MASSDQNVIDEPQIDENSNSTSNGGASQGVGSAGTDGMTEIQKQRLEERERLRTSKFDVVTSLFMSLILFIGALF